MRPLYGLRFIREIVCIMVALTILCLSPYHGYAEDVLFTEQEKAYIAEHKGKPLVLGLDPYSGMDYFQDQGEVKGYVLGLTEILERSTGLDIDIEGSKSWNDVYDGLFERKIDILFGANETPDRLRTMSFTKPVYQYPYVVMTKKDKGVQTIGDLDGMRVGYIEGDLVIDTFPSLYKNIQIRNMIFPDQAKGIEALLDESIEAFITANGGIVREFLYQYPELELIAEVRTVTSDMTLSTLKEDAVLVDIINKVLDNSSEEIQMAIDQALVDYNIKMLDLSPQERSWLKTKPEVTVGVANDYLPFDYYSNGKALGISGKVIDEALKIVGIQYKVVHGPFDQLLEMAKRGQLDILNLAKSDERMEYLYFPKPYSLERDSIYGRKESPYVQDIYQLEGKTVAVIKGFWHKEYLLKNLNTVNILETDSFEASLNAIDTGQADYFIENPTVSDYYITGLNYSDIIKKGNTSADSYLYFGVNRNLVQLGSLLDKTLTLVDYEKAKDMGLQTVPSLTNKHYTRLLWISAGLGVILIGVVVILVRLIRVIISQKTETELLKEREKLIYTDALTKLHNRMYFNHIEKALDEMAFPQSFIMTDLNDLKVVNDTYGHQWGDALIIGYAEVLKRVFDGHLIIRMGGDEFLIICEHLVGNALDDKLDEFMRACRETEIRVGHLNIQTLKAAYGYQVRTEKDQSVNDVISMADQAMYSCKSKMKQQN